MICDVPAMAALRKARVKRWRECRKGMDCFENRQSAAVLSGTARDDDR